MRTVERAGSGSEDPARAPEAMRLRWWGARLAPGSTRGGAARPRTARGHMRGARGWSSGHVAELLGFRERLKLLQRLVLDLPDALARDIERPANLVEGPWVLASEAVAKLQHSAFAVGQVLE